MRPKIIAVDFDDTLFAQKWPGYGEPIWPVINRVKEEQAAGTCIILWTCRKGASEAAAVEACKSVGIVPDYVNENHPIILDEWDGENTRKIFADEYWDDKAVSVMEVISRDEV